MRLLLAILVTFATTQDSFAGDNAKLRAEGVSIDYASSGSGV
jgi:hypothetical protein